MLRQAQHERIKTARTELVVLRQAQHERSKAARTELSVLRQAQHERIKTVRTELVEVLFVDTYTQSKLRTVVCDNPVF